MYSREPCVRTSPGAVSRVVVVDTLALDGFLEKPRRTLMAVFWLQESFPSRKMRIVQTSSV